jgi:hypothetical protein
MRTTNLVNYKRAMVWNALHFPWGKQVLPERMLNVSDGPNHTAQSLSTKVPRACFHNEPSPFGRIDTVCVVGHFICSFSLSSVGRSSLLVPFLSYLKNLVSIQGVRTLDPPFRTAIDVWFKVDSEDGGFSRPCADHTLHVRCPPSDAARLGILAVRRILFLALLFHVD